MCNGSQELFSLGQSNNSLMTSSFSDSLDRNLIGESKDYEDHHKVCSNDFLIDDIITLIFNCMDISERKFLLFVSKKFFFINKVIEESIVKKLQCSLNPSLPTYIQVAAFISNLKKDILEIQDELNCEELPNLLTSINTEDLFKLQNILKARDTYVLWKVLAEKINQSIFEHLVSYKLEDLLNIPQDFIIWCETHKEALGQVRSVVLSHKKLTFLPREIGKLTSLEGLYLACNKLKFLPGEIGNLIKLKECYISENGLSTLPEEFYCLKKLESLSLSKNKFKFLPPKIGELRSLKVLYLSGNELTSLPEEMVNLTNLKMLHLSSTFLLPKGFSGMLGLKIKYVSD